MARTTVSYDGNFVIIISSETCCFGQNVFYLKLSSFFICISYTTIVMLLYNMQINQPSCSINNEIKIIINGSRFIWCFIHQKRPIWINLINAQKRKYQVLRNLLKMVCRHFESDFINIRCKKISRMR